MSIAGHQGKATGEGRINRGKGSDEGSGTRSSLMWETIHIIENMGEWRPRYVIWENVKNVKSKYMRPNFDRYMVEMERLGYTNNFEVLDAREFGLPQSRKRGESMKEEKEQTVIDKTLLYLENYREMERYIKEAVSETSQVPNISKYNISAERAFLQSVRECRAETVILFEHLKQALASLKEDAEAAGEGYKYDALEAVYIKGKTYEDIVRETGCGRNSPKKWCKVMIQRLSIKLFGAKAIENDRNGVKTG